MKNLKMIKILIIVTFFISCATTMEFEQEGNNLYISNNKRQIQSTKIKDDVFNLFEGSIADNRRIPKAPTRITFNQTEKHTTLNWSKSSDIDGYIKYYEISKDKGNTWINAGKSLSYTLKDLSKNTVYRLLIRAVDNDNNYSKSATIELTTQFDWASLSDNWKRAIAHNVTGINGNEIDLTTQQKNQFFNLSNFNHNCAGGHYALDLSCSENQKLTDLSPLKYMRHLEVLRLNHNRISEIKYGDFFNLKKLRIVWMENNIINNIEDGGFVGVRDLEYLMIRHNQITVINRKKLRGLNDISQLLLGNNKIENLEINTFKDLEKLTYLDLENNRIGNLKKGAFDGLGNLLSLNLSDNRISVVEDYVFGSLSKVTHLKLPGNEISSLHNNTFKGLNSVSRIRLNRNKIKNVSDKAFNSLNTLNIIILRNQEGHTWTNLQKNQIQTQVRATPVGSSRSYIFFDGQTRRGSRV